MALSAALRAKVSQSRSRYAARSSEKTTKPKEGRNQYRILAPTHQQADWVNKEDGQWWADLAVHWIKADENGSPLAVVGDAEATFGEPSPVAAAVEAAIASAVDEDSKKLYTSWRSRKSILVNAIDRSDNDKVVILELTTTTFSNVLGLIEEYDNADQDITDPNDGLDIIIQRSGKGLNTEYSVMVAPNSPKNPVKPVTSDQLKAINNLPDYIRQNYFRGEEKKALAAISSTAGIAAPAITHSNSAVAISSAVASNELVAQQAARVEAAERQRLALEKSEAAATATATTAAPAATISDDLDGEIHDDILSELDGLID